MFQQAVQKLGGIDILLNNAGLQRGARLHGDDAGSMEYELIGIGVGVLLGL